MKYLQDFGDPHYENLQKARSILKKAQVDENSEDFQKLRKLLSRNLGYIGQFTNWMVNDKVPFDRLKSLYDDHLKGKARSLPKPVDKYEKPEHIIDDIISRDSEAAINQMISAIPSNTRSFLKEYDKAFSCEECCWNGKKPQPSCKNCGGTGNPYQHLISYLSSVRKDKEKIIKFFAAKGGRYHDYEEEEVFGDIISDISKLLDMGSIDELIARSKKDIGDVAPLYEDEKYYIIAVNYDGLRKYGSTMWCIHEDEDTFDEYVFYDGTHIQMILFDKKKELFVDRKSMMGITYNFLGSSWRSRVYAAHWENDDDAEIEAGNLLSKLNFKLPENYDKFLRIYPRAWENLGTESTMYIIRGVEPDDWDRFFDDMEDEEISSDIIEKYFQKLKPKIELASDYYYQWIQLVNDDLYKYCTVKDLHEHIGDNDEITELIEDMTPNTSFIRFISDLGDVVNKISHIELDHIDAFINNNIFTFDEVAARINNWTWEYHRLKKATKHYKRLMEIIMKKDMTKRNFEAMVAYIKDSKRIAEYRDKVIAFIESGMCSRSDVRFKIMDVLKDKKVDKAAIRYLLPKRIRDKYKIKFKKLKNFESFTPYKNGWNQN